MPRTLPLLSLLVAAAAVLAAAVPAAAQARWRACVSIDAGRTYLAGPGYWTDGFGADIGPSFDGSEVLVGAGTLCDASLLLTQPQDYHSQNEEIMVNVGPGQGSSSTVFDLDLFWSLCDAPIVLPLWAGVGGAGDVTTLVVVADYTVDPADPLLEMTIDGGFAYAGPLSLLVPADLGLEVAGELELTPCCLTDLDCDGDTGFADLVALLSAWDGACEEGPCAADLDLDGIVGLADLITLLAGWGPCTAPCP